MNKKEIETRSRKGEDKLINSFRTYYWEDEIKKRKKKEASHDS